MINWLEHWTSKKAKSNSLFLARLERNKHIERTPARQLSFKKFWQKHQANLKVFEKRSTRRQRRMLVSFLWRRIIKKQND